MCSICRSLGFQYRQLHTQNVCPYVRACYCTYCGTNGHTTLSCPNRFCNDSVCSDDDQDIDEYDTNKCRAINHKASLEVIDDESNIRAFLISLGISLSGKPETNRENLIQACKNHTPPLQLFWIHPNTKEEYRLQVDEPPPQKSKRGRKKKQAPQS